MQFWIAISLQKLQVFQLTAVKNITLCWVSIAVWQPKEMIPPKLRTCVSLLDMYLRLVFEMYLRLVFEMYLRCVLETLVSLLEMYLRLVFYMYLRCTWDVLETSVSKCFCTWDVLELFFYVLEMYLSLVFWGVLEMYLRRTWKLVF